MHGGVIRLDPVAAEIVIGEGIETAASAGLLLGLPAWGAIWPATWRYALKLPPQVRNVTIAADPDEPGRSAAAGAWHRWTSEGRRVRINTPNLAPATSTTCSCAGWHWGNAMTDMGLLGYRYGCRSWLYHGERAAYAGARHGGAAAQPPPTPNPPPRGIRPKVGCVDPKCRRGRRSTTLLMPPRRC